MAEVHGMTGTQHTSKEAGEYYERRALAQAWNDYAAYSTMDEAKRSAIDSALDEAMCENLGTSDVDQFVKACPEMESEANARAMQRYFYTKGKKPPYRLFDLQQARAALIEEGLLLVPSSNPDKS